MNHIKYFLVLFSAISTFFMASAENNVASSDQELTTTAVEAEVIPTPDTSHSNGSLMEAVAMTSGLPDVYKDAYKLTKEWHRSRVLKAVGWTTFGIGTGLLLGSAGWTYGCLLTDTHSNSDWVGIRALAIGGASFVAISVPLLIISSKYARKAKNSVKLDLSMSNIESTIGGMTVMNPAVGLRLSF